MGYPGDSAQSGRRTGRSGARFPSAKQLERLGDHETSEVAEEPGRSSRRRRGSAGRTTEVGRSGSRFPPAKLLETDENRDEQPPPDTAAAPADEPEAFEPDAEDAEDPYRLLVRPYVLTKGRTQTSKHYALETLITTRPGPAWNGVISNELHTVRELCVEPRSVAEVAALMSVPLGVARVLIGDMDDAGLVDVHASVATPEGRPDLDLMRRVLRGLHEL